MIEETLRVEAPVASLPPRYAVEDLVMGEFGGPEGVVIGKGEAILAAYAAAGRHPGKYGAEADRFNVTRVDKEHLAFGYGVHLRERLEPLRNPALFATCADLNPGHGVVHHAMVGSAAPTSVPLLRSVTGPVHREGAGRAMRELERITAPQTELDTLPMSWPSSCRRSGPSGRSS